MSDERKWSREGIAEIAMREARYVASEVENRVQRQLRAKESESAPRPMMYEPIVGTCGFCQGPVVDKSGSGGPLDRWAPRCSKCGASPKPLAMVDRHRQPRPPGPQDAIYYDLSIAKGIPTPAQVREEKLAELKGLLAELDMRAAEKSDRRS